MSLFHSVTHTSQTSIISVSLKSRSEPSVSNVYYEVIKRVKKGESQGGRCHTRTMMNSESDKTFKNERTPCDTLADCCGKKTREGVRRGGLRQELRK